VTQLPTVTPMRAPLPDSPPRPTLSAAVRGCAAASLVVVLDERLAALERLAAAGHIDADDVAEARAAFAAIREAGQAWTAWRRAAADGSDRRKPAAIPAPSAHEISTTEAAGMLGVSARRIRQLLAAGVLEGRLTGRTWHVSRPSVLMVRGVRSAA
jgi:excisionase family DNA binding protein